MNYLRYFSTLIAALFLASCADYLPGTGILAPGNIAGYEMDASGLEGSYNYRFAADGTYVLTKTNPSKRESAPKKGKWKWERKSPKSALLTLDDELVVSLEFTTRNHANALIPSSERLFAVEFEKPE